MLNLSHSQTSALVESLKQYDLSHVTARLASDRAVAEGSLAAGPGSQVVSVSVMLETALEELFMPYTEGQKYLERESKNLGELYSSYLYRFSRYHVRLFLGFSRIRFNVFYRSPYPKRRAPVF